MRNKLLKTLVQKLITDITIRKNMVLLITKYDFFNMLVALEFGMGFWFSKGITNHSQISYIPFSGKAAKKKLHCVSFYNTLDLAKEYRTFKY